ncbi:MAG: hypothetical protein U0894_11260 [Pirellulales bacterium]
MNPSPREIGDEWANQLVADWLDSDFQPSPQVIRQRGWSALVVADCLNAMEAEWLAESIASIAPETVCGIGLEYRSKPDICFLVPERDSLLNYNSSNSWRYVMLTSPDNEYLYFKDEANRFFLLCGPSEFVAQAYKCSWDTARIMYFDFWCDSENKSEDEKRYLKFVWEKYSVFRCPVPN